MIRGIARELKARNVAAFGLDLLIFFVINTVEREPNFGSSPAAPCHTAFIMFKYRNTMFTHETTYEYKQLYYMNNSHIYISKFPDLYLGIRQLKAFT